MALLWKRFLVLSLLFTVSFQAVGKTSDKESGAKVHFDKEKISLGGKTLNVEVAQTSEQHERGLMFRETLGENEGMLFVFPAEDIRFFWMKNTVIDLSIGYFNQNKELIDMQEMAATSLMEARPPSYPSAKPAMYGLEMKKGWFTKNKIKLGQKFQFIGRRQ